MLEYLSDWKLYFFVFFPLLIVYYWKNARIFYYGSKFDGPFAWPLFGNALMVLGNSDRAMDIIFEGYEQYRTPARVYLGHKLLICIAKPEHIEIILNSPNAFEKAYLYKFTKVFLGDGLFSAPVSKWRKNRKLMLPVFNLKTLSGFVRAFSEHSEELNETLENYLDKGFFDVYPVVHQCLLAMICETNLGIQLKDLPDKGVRYTEALIECLHIICKRIICVWFQLDFIFNLTSMSKKLYDCSSYITKLSDDIIANRINRRKQSIYAAVDILPKCRSLLDRLLELSAREDGVFSEQQIKDEVNTITFAGSETSGTTISFTLMLLGMHQDIQEKVYKELELVFKETDRPVEYEDLASMDLLERVIKEALRLFPPGPGLLREVEEDIKLDSYLVPKGSTCLIYVFYIHRCEELWENPLKFDPDRFLPEKVQKRHPYSYLPFSAGPRNCIGYKYAMFSMKSVLSTILRKYQVFTPYKSVEEIKVRADVITRAVEGNMISLKRRINK